MDLYEKIDAGSNTLKEKLLEKRMKEGNFTEKINNALGRACKANEGESVFCLSSKSFTVKEFESITQGDVRILQTHLAKNVNITTDSFNTLKQKITNLWSTIKKEAKEEQNGIEKTGSLGIYIDGVKENSSFDLTIDLQKIHDIIFSKK